MVGTIENITFWQWALVIGSSLLLFLFSPWAKSPEAFYSAQQKGTSPNWVMLTGSLVISWVFAKSIANASDLGYQFGIVGGLAYAAYYLSFIVAGVVIYYLRKNGGFTSIHDFLRSRYGRRAIQLFSLVIAFRLFNEIWSNTMVIGSYFGENGSTSYYLSIVVFTILTLAYTLKGGLKSSIFSDAIQMLLFAVLLIVLLYMLTGEKGVSVTAIIQTGTFAWDQGLNLLAVALLQAFSYPFHDPVLTDRGFISPLRTTLRSFILAGIIGGLCIFLFSFLGIFSQLNGQPTNDLSQLGKLFGPLFFLLINFIMIVSAASTLDSSFSSFSKLVARDLKLGQTVKFGRVTMVIVAVAGTVPIFFSPSILSATTVSGTMVIGLTPIFLFWWIKAPPISFYLSFFGGIIVGIAHVFDLIPSFLVFTDGPYNKLLAANCFGIVLCLSLFFIPLLLQKRTA